MASGPNQCRSQRNRCVPQQITGIILILVGILLLCLFVPFETWLAVIGVALIVGGVLLKML